MSKTFSVAIKNSQGVWITNWHEYFKLAEIDFAEVEAFCNKRGDLAYGYYYGTHSRNLKSSRCRTVVKELEKE